MRVLAAIDRAKHLVGLELARKSPSFVHRVEPRYNSVSFKITANCNSLCISCGEWKEVSRGELTVPEIEDVMRQLRELGVRSFNFSGGEPTLRRELPELVAYASKEMGFRTGMTTNGLTLTEKKARSVLEAGLGIIGFSVEGTREVHDHIRGAKGFYDRTVRSIKIAAGFRKDFRFVLNVGFTLMKPNLDYLIPMVEELAPLGITFNLGLVNFTTQQFRIGDGRKMGLWPDDLAKLEGLIDQVLAINRKTPGLFGNVGPEWKTYALEYFKHPKGERIPCSIGFFKLYIDPHGNVYPCWPLSPTGNLRQNTLREVLDGEAHRKALRDMLNLNCPGCSCNTYSNRFNSLPRIVKRKWDSLVGSA